MHVVHIMLIWVGFMTACIRSNDSEQIRQYNTAIGRHPHKRIIHPRLTQLTLLVNIMTHTTFTQSHLSVSASVNPLFCSMSTRAGESSFTSASAKQKPVHCAPMATTNDKDPDMDIHAVPPDYRTGGDYGREAPSSGRPGAMRDPLIAGEGKVDLQTNTDGEQHIRRFDDPAKSFQLQIQQEQEFYTIVLHGIFAIFGKDPQIFVSFRSKKAIWRQFTSDC